MQEVPRLREDRTQARGRAGIRTGIPLTPKFSPSLYPYADSEVVLLGAQHVRGTKTVIWFSSPFFEREVKDV